MPFARPTLAALVARVRSDLRGRLEVDGPLLRRAMVDALGAVWGGAMHEVNGFLDWAVKQLFGYSADREYLVPKAAMYDVTPTPATYATGTATATGTDGEDIPVDTILRLDENTAYRVTTGQTIAGGTATLPITAILAGSVANVPAGTTLTFESPITGVDATATVVADIEDGVDEEGTEELRDRYLLRLREPPEGGADQDYEAWAIAVPGVTRAWVYPHELGLGTVVVRFVLDNEDDIFPDAGAVADVQAALEEERPITAEVTAVAPAPLEVDFTIHLDPANADTKAAVEAELEDMFRRVAEPGDGGTRGTILLSKIHTAIGIAAGVDDYELTVPAANVVPALGELCVLGEITWV